jgi:hypothetical protein
MAAATKKKKRKEEAYPWNAGASSGHITNLKQSVLETFDIYSLKTSTLAYSARASATKEKNYDTDTRMWTHTTCGS